ncbi:YfhO family protein [Candidatus Omnitrophota bacterium]
MKRIIIEKKGWLKEAVPFFILIALVAIFFSDVLFEGKIFVHRDLSRFFYPLREFSVTQFLCHKVPLWNPYIHCGSPHLAELQTCVFYPLSVIYLFFSYPHAFNYFIILHIFLAGLFTYILMRSWAYSRYASFFSSIAFMFSGYIISVINLPASLASIVWLPLAILFYERSLKKEWIKNSMITGIFLAFMFLGGEPIIVYSTVFILLLLGRPNIKPLGLSLLVMTGLSCFQILPFLEFVGYSSRASMDFGEASMWSFPPYALLDLFVPYLSESDYLYKDYWGRQSWLLVYYMGIFTLLCAFLALKFVVTKRRKVFFYILALGLILSFGRYTPVYYFLYKLMPGFSLSRYPIKFFFMVSFSLAILAGMGLDYYREAIKSNHFLKRFLKTILILAFVASFFYLAVNLNFTKICSFLHVRILNSAPYFMDKKDALAQFILVGVHNLKRAIGIFMFLALFMFFGLRRKMNLNLLIPVLISVALWDVFTANVNIYKNMDIDEHLKPGKGIEFLKKDKALFRIFDSPATLRQNTFVPERDYLEGMRSLRERLVSNRGVSFQIYDAYGYGSLYNRRHEEVMDIIIHSDLPDDTNLLNLLNVKYVISPKDFEAKGYHVAEKTDKVNIYENRNVMARAFLADNVKVLKDEKEILETLKSKEFDPSEEIILEEEASLRRTDFVSDIRSEKVSIVKYEPNEIIIEAKAKSEKFLVLSDSYYPGWEAYVDGSREKIYRADYILRAVRIEPGEHIVRFRYNPLSLKIGMLVTLVTIAALFGFWFVSILRQKKSKG